MSVDQERRLSLIDKATDDWLGKQEFPKKRFVPRDDNRRAVRLKLWGIVLIVSDECLEESSKWRPIESLELVSVAGHMNVGVPQQSLQ